MTTTQREWLNATHPVWDAWAETWAQNERRLKGGWFVLDELRPFDWEVAEGRKAYEARRKQATYMNFPDIFLTAMAGHLMRKRPTPPDSLDFGSLGSVVRAEGASKPDLAEVIYYNTDGIGMDGSQWDNFWMAAWRRAGATGHRWIMVEAPAQGATNVQEQIQGLRPYLVEYSPVVVTNWSIRAGQLDWAIVRVGMRVPKVSENGTLGGNNGENGYLLLVRAGVQDLGAEYAGGGWWLYGADKKEQQKGQWEATQGDIPMFPLFYERDTGVDALTTKESGELKAQAAMSRPGITELGQAAISYMNLSSAADFDVWDAAKSMTFLSGMDADGWNLAMAKIKEGSRYVPLKPATSLASAAAGAVTVQDSATGAVASDTFDKVLSRKLAEVEKLAMREATSVPDSSGESKNVGFMEAKAPKLAMFAAELENAQNTALYFLEQRAGAVAPAGMVNWTREFDLTDVSEIVRDVLGIEKLAGLSSPTLESAAMMKVVEARQLVTGDKVLEAVRAEYQESATEQQTAKAQKQAFASSFGFGG
jgi:hypothetical protein